MCDGDVAARGRRRRVELDGGGDAGCGARMAGRPRGLASSPAIPSPTRFLPTAPSCGGKDCNKWGDSLASLEASAAPPPQAHLSLHHLRPINRN
jgi:hypothetical protein